VPYIEIDWKASTAARANNGILAHWIDGVRKANFTTIDNDTRRTRLSSPRCLGWTLAPAPPAP